MKSRPKVVISSWVHTDVVSMLGRACTVVPNDTREALDSNELRRRCNDAYGLLAFMSERIDEVFLEKCPGLRIIACALKGYDNFDAAACTRHGVWLTIVPDLLTAPTAELTIGLMIALARNILPGDRLVRAGTFRGWRPQLYGQGIDGSTIGLLGAGAVGKAVARRLAGFRATILYADEVSLLPDQEDELRLRRVSRDELLEHSDYVVLCLPLLSATLHLVNREFLARMKRGAFLINTARGSLIDEVAVAAALENNTLAGYAADVFAMEDWALPARPTEVSAGLRDAANKTVLTPHLGSAVDRVRRDISMQAAKSILQAMRGEIPSGAVNGPFAPREAS